MTKTKTPNPYGTKPGDVVAPVTGTHAYTVLSAYFRGVDEDSLRSLWLVLCLLPHNERHPFAVFRASCEGIDREYGKGADWRYGSGQYCETLTEALEWYQHATALHAGRTSPG